MPMDPLHYTGRTIGSPTFENQTNKSFSIQIQVLSKELGQIILSLKPKYYAILTTIFQPIKISPKLGYTILSPK